MMSKGDTQRPRQVSDEDYADRWDAIFGTKPPVVPNDFRLEPDICSVCGRTMVDGLCPEQERTQDKRT